MTAPLVSPYTIAAADADEYADELNWLQDQTELPRCTYPDVSWWLAFFEGMPVAYLGQCASQAFTHTVYLCRVGVLAKHRGNRLQLRLMRVAERAAKRHAFGWIVSDTRFNPPSANNFIRAGYEIFAPPAPWGHLDAIYWRKRLASH